MSTQARGSNKKPLNKKIQAKDEKKSPVKIASNKKVVTKLSESPTSTLTILQPKPQMSHSPTKSVITPNSKRELVFEPQNFGNSFKIVSKDFEFQSNTKMFTENQNFKVIGTIGESKGKFKLNSQQVGKSYVLKKFLSGQDFKQEKTKGIDVYITNKERFILIDTQALFGSSNLYDAIVSDKPLPLDTVNYENLIDLQTIKMGLFLLNICDILLVTLNDLNDYKTLQFVKSLHLLQKGLFSKTKISPEIVFVYNEMNVSTIQILKLTHFLNDFFKDTSLKKNGYVHPFQWTNEMMSKNEINFFILEDEKTEDIFVKLIKTLSIEKEENLTEIKWFQNTSTIWDWIQKSHLISEYNRCFQKLQLYK
jgi:hypothetical protein